MYVNFNLLKRSGLNASELLLLQGIKQKEYSLFSKATKTLKKLEEEGWLKTVGKKTSVDYRLDKKAKTFLRDMEIADISGESKYLAQSLISLYEDKGIKITNKKKIVELCSWFLSEIEIEIDVIISVVADYLNTTETKYTSKLDNLLWKGDSVWANNWNLSQSKLYGMLK